jgi:hypothetical protein
MATVLKTKSINIKQKRHASRLFFRLREIPICLNSEVGPQKSEVRTRKSGLLENS